MSLKFTTGESTGVALELQETRDVLVTEEALDGPSGFEGDTIVYTATVKDDEGLALPETFVVSLKIPGMVDVVTDQVLEAAVYDSVTFLLTLSWAVPEVPFSMAGAQTVKLSWIEQII